MSKTLIEKLEASSPKGVFTHPENKGYAAGYKDAFDIVRQHTGWRDIASAPRDRTHIIVFNPDKQEPEVAWYAKSEAQWRWQTWDNGYLDGWCKHWMPLPPPPQGEQP